MLSLRSFFFVLGTVHILAACEPSPKSESDAVYMTIPRSSVDCAHRLLTQMGSETQISFRFHKVVHRPPGGNDLEHLLELSAPTPQQRDSAALEITVSSCFPKHANIYSITDPEALNNASLQLRSLTAEEIAYIDYIDGEIYVFIHRPLPEGEDMGSWEIID